MDKSKTVSPLWHLPLIVLAMVSLLAGVWGGLLRLLWELPFPNGHWIAAHGPLAVSGFLGTVIGLERAAALRTYWPYLAPISSGAGGLVLILGIPDPAGPLLIFTGSLALTAVSAVVVRRQPAVYTITMSLGALVWATGNLLWLVEWPIHRLIPWWGGFLILTVAGERLQLARFLPSSSLARPLFLLAACTFLAGLVSSAFFETAGERLAGAGMTALSIWLCRFDISRKSPGEKGLARFMALSLLAGYAWLGAAGLIWATSAPLLYGFTYDAALHALFLGFVFAMIFGHGPIIFPAVLHLPIRFHKSFYLHLVLLNASLLLRIAGDILRHAPARSWGGLLNAAAVGLFIVNTAVSILREVSRRGR